MSLIARAAERAFGPLVPDFCMTCRGPILEPGIVVIELGADEELLTCEVCGRRTDAGGRCIERVSTGTIIEIIEIEAEPDEGPDRTSYEFQVPELC